MEGAPRDASGVLRNTHESMNRKIGVPKDRPGRGLADVENAAKVESYDRRELGRNSSDVVRGGTGPGRQHRISIGMTDGLEISVEALRNPNRSHRNPNLKSSNPNLQFRELNRRSAICFKLPATWVKFHGLCPVLESVPIPTCADKDSRLSSIQETSSARHQNVRANQE